MQESGTRVKQRNGYECVNRKRTEEEDKIGSKEKKQRDTIQTHKQTQCSSFIN